MAKQKHYLKIYKKPIHVLTVVGFVALPFLFVLLMTNISFTEKFGFLDDLLLSSYRLAIAYVISVAIALVLGITLSTGKRGAFFLPVFDVLQSFPSFALLPLAVHFWGPSVSTVIFFLVITIVWPILFAVISSLKLTHASWDEAAAIYGAKGYKKLIHVSLPISFPALVTGSIVGLGEGWEAVVGAEIVIGVKSGGLGRFFDAYQASPSLVFFGVTALLLFIFVINKFIFLPLLDKSHKLLAE